MRSVDVLDLNRPLSDSGQILRDLSVLCERSKLKSPADELLIGEKESGKESRFLFPSPNTVRA